MNIENLEKLGLTKGESKVYLTMLKIGKSSIGNIIKISGVSHSKIYDILERLGQKGLISTITEKGKKHFEAKNPNNLNNFLNDKEEEIKKEKKLLKSILPGLQDIFNDTGYIQNTEVLLGYKGIKTFLEMILNEVNKDDIYYILGVPKKTDYFSEGYFKEWYDKIEKKGVTCKILYNPEMLELAKKRKKSKKRIIKIMPTGSDTTSGINIINDWVAIHIFGENPACIVIKNREVAKTYKNYFNIIWNSSKELEK